MLLAVERAYPQPLDAAQRLICLQLAHVGMRVQVHIGRTDYRLAIARAEPRGTAELPHFRPHDAGIEGQRDQGGIAPLPVASPVLVRSQLEERLRARIERVQLVPTNRPSAVGNPCPLFKVDRIQGGAEPRPVSGGAAEVMQARGLEGIVRQTDALTAVQVLHRRLVVETTAFEQEDLVTRADPFQRHADAGRAGAHDAQVGFEHAAVRKGSSVDMHGGTSRGQLASREKRALWRASVTETTHPCSTIVRPTAKSCSTSLAMDERHGRAARMAAYSACASFSVGTSARYRTPILRTACGPMMERRSGCANVSGSIAALALAPSALPLRPANALTALTPRNRRRFMLTSGTRLC